MTQEKVEVIVNGGWEKVSVGIVNNMFKYNLHVLMGKKSFVPKVKSFDKTIVLNTNSGMTESDFAKLLKKLVKTPLPLDAKKYEGCNQYTNQWYKTIHINLNSIQPEFLETFLQKFLKKMQDIESQWGPTYNDDSIAPEKTVVSQSAPAFVPAPAPATSYWASQPAPAPAPATRGDSNFPPLRTSAESDSVQPQSVASPAPKVPVEQPAQPDAQQDVSVDSLGQELEDLQIKIKRDEKKILDAEETVRNLTFVIERNKKTFEEVKKAYRSLLLKKLTESQQDSPVDTTQFTQADKDNNPRRLWGEQSTEEALADAKAATAAANTAATATATAAGKGIQPVSAHDDQDQSEHELLVEMVYGFTKQQGRRRRGGK